MAAVMEEVNTGQQRPLLMTSWHTNDTLTKVVEFFFRDARVVEWEPEVFVALVLGGGEELRAEVQGALVLGDNLFD